MISKSKNVAIVILAAGESKRMGKPKQMLPWKKSTLLANCLNEAIKSEINDIYLVLGANYQTIHNVHKSPKVKILHNKKWSLGLGQSIAFATDYINSKPYAGILFLLADQPQVDSVYINQMLLQFNPEHENILVTTYPNNMGIPVLFNRIFFIDLITNTASSGAKSILNKHKDRLVKIIPKHPILDIDTPEDYQFVYDLFHK